MKKISIEHLYILIGVVALAFILLLGINTIQKIQSKDLDAETIIINKNGDQVEPVIDEGTLYGG